MSDELKAKVQSQFGVSADGYATSDVHARGDSLPALLELVQPQAAGYYNAYEKLRDPSHHWVYPQVRLEAMFAEAGLAVVKSSRILMKELEFHDWADRQHVSPEDKDKLLIMMRNLPPALEPLFSPRWTEETMYFNLWEVVILAQKQAE